jgi:hypothetical protein
MYITRPRAKPGFCVTLVLVSNTFRLLCDICLGEHHLHSYSKLSHMIGAIAPITWLYVITFYSYTKHLFQHWSNSKKGYISFYTTALSYISLLCYVSHYFIMVFTTLLWVSLLCCRLHYSAVHSTYSTAYRSAWFMSISC